jgi:hypothetical protein
MKMDLFRNRTVPKKEKSQKMERLAKSQPPRESGRETEIDIDSLAQVMSTEDQVEAAYSLGGSTERSSRSTARTGTVDDILDSDDDNDEIFMDEDEDNEEGLRTSQTWDESYRNAQNSAVASPSATSAPGSSTLFKGSPSSMNARNNEAGVEYAAMAVASSALCAVPGKLAQRADLLGNISDSDSSPATRQRSDASNMSSDDDLSVESFEGKKKSGSGGHSSEDYTDDEDEGEDGYKPGGYHPVKLGEVYNQRYVDPGFLPIRYKHSSNMPFVCFMQ